MGLYALLLGAALLGQEAGPPVRITEIHFHPRGDEDREEFIELHNPGEAPVDLSGWEFSSGVSFTFPAGTVLPPGGYLAVCADAVRVREVWGIENVLGNWEGRLSNDGERIRLSDPEGQAVQTVRYGDEPPWPHAADGLGPSLERIHPLRDNDHPGNWAASRDPSSWRWFRVEGKASLAASVLQLYLEGAGEMLVEEVELRRDRSALNLLRNGSFEAGLEGWTVRGNHAGSTAVEGPGPAGGAAQVLRIVSTGRGGSSHLVSQTFEPPLLKGEKYVVELWARPAAGRSDLRIALSGATASNGGLTGLAAFPPGTPGRRNTVASEDLPPYIFPVWHDPPIPVAGDEVLLLASVVDDRPGPLLVEVHLQSDEGEAVLPLLDDGLNGDNAASDGIHGVRLGSFHPNTLIRYYLTARDSAGQISRFPESEDPGTAADPLTPELGIYVEPPDLTSEFPIYHILLAPGDLGRLGGNPKTYVPGTFVAGGQVFAGVQVRYRGQTSINYPKKHWKVKLNDDWRFHPPELENEPHNRIRNLNLNSSWGDKTFMREHLSYEMWREVGGPHLLSWYCRVYLNGAFSGFHIYVEQPNADLLRRNELNPEGYLWKSFSMLQGGTMGDVRLKVPNPQPATPAVPRAIAAGARFAQRVSGPATKDDQLPGVLEQMMDVPGFVDFQALNVLIHNCDQPAKNYLIYGDAETDRWTYLPWDMDLTFGRNYVCGEPVPPGQNALTNDVVWFNERYGHLFFGTREHPKCDGPWNGAVDAFFFRTADYRDLLYARVAELNEALLKPEILLPRVEDLRVRLRDEVDADRLKWGSYGQEPSWNFEARVADLVNFVRSRYANLRLQLGDRLSREPEGLTCTRRGATAEVRWRNRGEYQSIKVYLNGELRETLPGDRQQVDVPLSASLDLDVIRVSTIYNGKERLGTVCAVSGELEGYRIALAEDFSRAPGSTAMSAAWSVNGFARHKNGRLELTPEDPLRVGSAFHRLPIPSGDFVADFDFAITGTATGGEGLTLAWIRDGPEAVGGVGAKLGFFGLNGYAVEFDTARSTGETSARHVGLDSSEGPAGSTLASADLASDLEGAGFHHVRVVRRGGQVVVSLSNRGAGLPPTEVLSADLSAPDEEMNFGFTASSGSGVARSAHLVDNFILRVPREVADPLRPAFTAEPVAGRAPFEVRFRNHTAGIGVDGYQWNFGDGEMSAEEHPVHVYTRPGVFDVSLVARAGSLSARSTRQALVRVSGSYLFIRGDANLSGSLDISDARTILEHLFQRLRDDLRCLKAMDVNDSGGLEISDAVYLLRHLFLGGPAPPPPYSTAGPDPTPDSIPCPDLEP